MKLGPRTQDHVDDMVQLVLSPAILQPRHFLGPGEVGRVGSSVQGGPWAACLAEAGSLLGHVQTHEAVWEKKTGGIK